MGHYKVVGQPRSQGREFPLNVVGPPSREKPWERGWAVGVICSHLFKPSVIGHSRAFFTITEIKEDLLAGWCRVDFELKFKVAEHSFRARFC